MPDFLETGPSIAEILRYFDFSNDRCRHLGFLNLWNFIGRQCRRAQTHHHAKCRKNWSFCCGDIAVFRIFKMATTGILDFLNHEILLAIGVQRSRRICMPNFVKIGQSVAKIWRFFFDFSSWRLPPSWIVKFANFYWLTVSEGPRCIIEPNFVKIGLLVGR